VAIDYSFTHIDYLQEGSLFVSLNRGGYPPRFEFIGKIKEDRFPQENVRLGDIDGDGRLDFCGVDGDGTVTCWRNGGVGDAPTSEYDGYWQGMVGCPFHSLVTRALNIVSSYLTAVDPRSMLAALFQTVVGSIWLT
jgi:hypothetical protein